MTSNSKRETALRRAYELAATGKFSDAAMVEAALEYEGFREVAGWINKRSISDALTEICLSARRERAEGAEQPTVVVALP
jgi:hypothetical protein